MSGGATSGLTRRRDSHGGRYFKNHPIGAVYEPDLSGRTLLISFMTLAELERWAIQSKMGKGSA